MRNLKLFALFIALTLISCERDDICAESTATTPRLFIEFYDVSNPDDLKSVLRLTVYGEGLPDPNPPEASVDETLLFNENSNSVQLPLRIDTEGVLTTSRFKLEKETNLRLDTDPLTDSNIDIIEISYIPEFLYVSRACGYKSIFNTLEIDLDPDGNTWIDNIDIVETTIKNENTVHVRIFH
ncbi:DUF6452 family protein [uncultured Winogradskyella sp.]|uniref:DUF6452 family protein n=1 Tax=uncultured Winogradskyella sp. TaxID=395353 RepID=UPI0030DA366A|tara:strand:- start:389 stop:934 length:546 start_codon:yes stop_codon:yes gene_type:complete